MGLVGKDRNVGRETDGKEDGRDLFSKRYEGVFPAYMMRHLSYVEDVESKLRLAEVDGEEESEEKLIDGDVIEQNPHSQTKSTLQPETMTL